MFTLSVPSLEEIHSSMRPHDSEIEKAFSKKYLDCVPGMTKDKAGNRLLKLGDASAIYSCHVDTVHRLPGLQKTQVSKKILSLAEKGPTCLGSDDGAGIYLMLRMIQVQVPGLYIFHRGEECGGIGSIHIARHADWITKYKAAIAFDRMGYTDIITHQGGHRTCSDTFAWSLAGQLSLGHEPSSGGLFTDTANYEHLIPECTNLSVGYHKAHSPEEFLDLDYLEELATILCTKFHPQDLEIERDPLIPDSVELDDWWVPGKKSRKSFSLEDTIRENPAAILEILQDYGVGEDEINQYVYDHKYLR